MKFPFYFNVFSVDKSRMVWKIVCPEMWIFYKVNIRQLSDNHSHSKRTRFYQKFNKDRAGIAVHFTSALTSNYSAMILNEFRKWAQAQ